MTIAATVLAALLVQCAPSVSPVTLNALILTESGGNPFAIANVTDGTSRFFQQKEEAISYARSLEKQGKNYSAGLMQINSINFRKYQLNSTSVFDACQNISAGAKILTENYKHQKEGDEQLNLKKSLSLYYSGNEKTGFVKEKKYSNTSYVERVAHNVYDVPALKKSDDSETPAHQSESNNTRSTNNSWDVFGDFNS